MRRLNIYYRRRKSVPLHRNRDYSLIENKFLDEYILQLKEAGVRVYLALSREEQMTSAELKDFTGLSKQGVMNGTAELMRFGLIKRVKTEPHDAKSILWKDGDLYRNSCSWCKSTSVALHSHYFPIPKREGGLDTVHICTDCHQKFHSMVDHGIWELV
jgi:hypothetical protein